MHHALALLLQTVDREAGIPLVASWSGVVGFVVSLISLAAVLIGYGRWLEKLNGVGKRVAALETESGVARTERQHLQRELTRMVDNVTSLTKDLGRHERGTDQCREDTEKLGINLGSEIHKLTSTVSDLDKHLSVRLAQVETILRERGMGEQ